MQEINPEYNMNWASDVDSGKVNDEILKTLSAKVRCSPKIITHLERRQYRRDYFSAHRHGQQTLLDLPIQRFP